MSHLKRDKKIKLVGSELDIFLTTEIGVLSWFNGTKIKFNPHPFSENKNLDEKDENLVDFHLDIVKKIDALIAEREKEVGFEEELEGSLDEVVEMREQSRRKLEMSDFKVEVQPGNILENVFDDVDSEDELFEIEHLKGTGSDFKFVTGLEKPKDIRYIKRIESEHVKNRGFLSRMLGGQYKASQKSVMGFTHIKVRGKDERAKLKADQSNDKLVKRMPSSQKAESKVEKKKTGKINNFTKTKKELEETKKAIEEKKKELEEAEEKAKAKEKELKRKEKERLEKERKKLEEIEVKKSMEEARKKEEELKRRLIEKQKKKREEERLKKLELKKAREAKLRTKELREKARVEEKRKKLEAERILSEERLKRSLEREKRKVKEKRVAKSKKEPVDVLKIKKREDKKEKTNGSAPDLHHFILGKREPKGEKQVDDDVKKVLTIVDDLLGELPEAVIDEFVKSEDFALYERVISRYKNK